MVHNERSKRKIIPVASGKGGVGKSLFASNLALRLAANGADTVIIDLDLGGSNLHTYLGLRNTKAGIGNFLSNSKTTLSDVIHDAQRENLRYAPGDVLVSGISRLTPAQRKKITESIEKLKADYVIIDLGSGTSELVIDMFLLSNSGIVVTTPQAPAALNAYGLLKNLLFYRLKEEFGKSQKISNYLRTIQKDKKPGATPTLDQIVEEIKKIDGNSAKRAKKVIGELKPLFVLNMFTDPNEFAMLLSLRKLVKRNLGIDPTSLGTVFHDSACARAVSELKPITELSPLSVSSYQIERIAQKIMQSDNFPEMPLDFEEYADSYELTRLEIEADIEQYGIGGGTSDSDQKEFVEVISKQKQEIEELKRTIRMISAGK